MKETIMNAAGALFKERGFSATTTRDIAKRARIHLGSLHYWFPSKKAVLLEMMTVGMERSLTRLKRISEGHDPADKKIFRAIENHLDLILGPNPYIFVLIYEWRSLHKAELAEIIQKRDAYENLWKKILSEKGDGPNKAGTRKTEIQVKVLLGAMNWSPVWFSPGKGYLSVPQLAEEIFETLFPRQTEAQAL